jgi:TolB-like protein/DNA-binding winged helix-turn-helix (wHTH) protein/Tfp pilus assembly protein PilF
MARAEKVCYAFGPFRLDTAQHLLFRNGELIALPPKAADALVILVKNHGHLVEKDELMKAVWPDTFVEDANLTVHISGLRKILQDGEGVAYIETVPRRGYRFVAPVLERPEPMDAPSGLVPEPTRSGWRWPAIGIGLVIASCVLVLAFSGWQVSRRHKTDVPARQIRALAVLPLKNLTGDPSQEYLADGLTEALVTDLSQVRSLRVISRTSAMSYKNTTKKLPEIARELNVDAVVEGSVVRSGERVRVTAQLIEAASDTHLWAQQYDGSMPDLLELQSRVAQAITQQVGAKLTPQHQLKLAAVHLGKSEAVEDYLLGRYYWNKRTEEGFTKAVEYFERAIEKDPQNSLAYAGLADSYVLLAEYTLSPSRDVFPKARNAAVKALELDESLAEAHTSLAAVKLDSEWDWRSAEQELVRAIELNPNYATAHQWYAELLSQESRYDEAVVEVKRALDLDPLSLIVNSMAGRTFLFAGLNDQAIDQLQKTLDIDPDFSVAHYDLGKAYLRKGNVSEAIAEFKKAATLLPLSEEKAALAYAYTRAGRRAEANRLLQTCLKQSSSGYVSWYGVTFIYVGLGEKDQAFESLEKAYQQHDSRLRDIKQEPVFESLRSDQRFSQLVHRVGLK